MEKFGTTKKITIKPVITGNTKGLPFDHEAAFIHTGAKQSFALNLSQNPFTRRSPEGHLYISKDEIAVMASALGVEVIKLNPVADNSYFDDKTIAMDKTGTTLQLDRIDDYIKYLILISHPEQIVEGNKNLIYKPTARWVIIDPTEDMYEVAASVDDKFEAISILNKYINKPDKLKDILDLYNYKHRAKARLGENTNAEFVLKQLKTIADENPSNLLGLIKDENFNFELKILRMLDVKTIQYRNNSYYADFKPEAPIASSYSQLVEFFKDEVKNTEMLLAIGKSYATKVK